MSIFLPHGVLQQQTGGATTLVHDTFTDSDSTALTAHTPNTDVEGGGWSFAETDATPDPIISSNQFRAPAHTGTPTFPDMVSYIDSGVADVVIDLDGYMGVDVFAWCGVALRYTDNNNYWSVWCRANDNFLYITERNAGTTTNRASIAFTTSASTSVALHVVASGSTITATADGGSEASYSSATLNQSVGVHGIVVRRASTSFLIADNLIITTL